jgi:hypothetical protein
MMNRSSVAQYRLLLEYGAHIDQPDDSSSTLDALSGMAKSTRPSGDFRS